MQLRRVSALFPRPTDELMKCRLDQQTVECKPAEWPSLQRDQWHEAQLQASHQSAVAHPVRRPVLFNIFMNDLHDWTGCSHSNFADDTQLEGLVNTLEEFCCCSPWPAAIQRDPGGMD